MMRRTGAFPIRLHIWRDHRRTGVSPPDRGEPASVALKPEDQAV